MTFFLCYGLNQETQTSKDSSMTVDVKGKLAFKCNFSSQQHADAE